MKKELLKLLRQYREHVKKQHQKAMPEATIDTVGIDLTGFLDWLESEAKDE